MCRALFVLLVLSLLLRVDAKKEQNLSKMVKKLQAELDELKETLSQHTNPKTQLKFSHFRSSNDAGDRAVKNANNWVKLHQNEAGFKVVSFTTRHWPWNPTAGVEIHWVDVEYYGDVDPHWESLAGIEG
eukprot:TRINITY_DN115404_c0_g1_i1.p1 TRINITY_DN115404_c0_g1~~TRINITY_DN115404_c0_g1_i1.p1  ORF type:complete len:129 (-),score=0.28 TRINITY_DN115404_c0_g1_i1:215-601(-)